MDTNVVLVTAVAVALISTGVLAAGLAVGYWRGFKRGKQQALAPGSEIDRLAGVGRAILSTQLRLDALCEVVYQQATRVVDTTNFQLGLFQSDDYVAKVWVRDGERRPEHTFAGAASSGIVGWVRSTAQGLRVDDYQREWDTLPARPVRVTESGEQQPRSAVFTPLIAAGDVIGVLIVQSDAPNSFTEDDQRLLNVLASQVAGALHNAQLYEQSRERVEQLKAISEIGRQITAIQALSSLFRQIVTIIHQRFRFHAVSIFTFDTEQDELRLRASSQDDFDRKTLTLKPGEGIVGWAYAEAKTVNVPDVTQHPRYVKMDELADTRSEICIPLVVEHRVLGILDVQSTRLQDFKPEDVFALESLAGQIAMAIQEAQAYENTRRQAERINAMAEASRAVVSILDINDLLDEVVDLVADYFGYDRVHLFLRTGERVVFRSGSGVHSAKWAIDRLAYSIDDRGFIPWVARTGEALVTGNVLEDERYVIGPGLEDSRSEMTIPISMGQRVLGVFDIQSPKPQAFDPEDVRLVEALADTVAIGLRNAGLFATEQRRRALAETVRDVSTVLTSSLDLESVLDGILVGLERVVHFNAAMILLRREEAGHCVVSAVRGVRNEADVLGEIVPLDDRFLPAVWELLYHMETDDAADDPDKHDHLYAPLKVGGEDIGTLAIDRYDEDRFSPEDVEIINTFANQAAVAITNAQLYTAQKEEAWVSTALLQVAEATSRSTSLDEVLSTVAQITPLLSSVEWCIVFLADNRTFRVVELEGVPESMRTQFKGAIFHASDWDPFLQLYAGGKPVVMLPPISPPSTVDIDLSRVAQAVLLPLYAKGDIMGAMLIAQREGDEPLTERKIELVSGIANQAALAIEGAQLFAAQQEEAWVTTALLSVAESVNSTLGLEQTLETLVRLTPMLVGVTRCAIMHWEQHTAQFVGGAVYGLDASAEKQFVGLRLTADDTFIEALSRSEEPIPAGGDLERQIPEAVESLFDCTALLFLPLIAKGTLVGCMIVDYQVAGEQINQRRMHILTGIAHQSALALQTARLLSESTERQRLERELEVASGIQHSFLPQQLPSLPGWGLAAFYRAARQVGGDFYDFIPLRGNKYGIVVADVADKGVPAALFMALSRTNIRAAAFSRDDPVATLARVNELLLADSRSDLFVTVWYGVWDPDSGEITYASAGHNPPLLVRANGEISELTARGIALNVVETLQLDQKQVRLEPGDVLIAYTDGLSDALRNDGAEFGVAGLRSTAEAAMRYDAEYIRQHVVDAVDRFTGNSPQFDDVTLVVLKNQALS